MKDLIEALQIFAKYIPDAKHPTNCEHDALFVACEPADVSVADTTRLGELSFDPTDEGFRSFRFGSC